MINTNEIIEFFDRLAPNWDADMIRYDDVINLILDNAGVKRAKTFLMWHAEQESSFLITFQGM